MICTSLITRYFKFFIAGINYKKSMLPPAGKYAINNEQYANIFARHPLFGINELFVLSTCNRTEIYGFAEDANQLIQLLCSQTAGDRELSRNLLI